MSEAQYARRVLIAAGIGLLFVALLLVLGYIAHMLLVIFAGILLAIVVDGAARRLREWTGIPRKIDVFVVVLGTLALLGAVSWYSGPQLAEQFGQLAQRIPEAFQEGRGWLAEQEWGEGLVDRFEDGEAIDAGAVLGGVTGVFASVIGVVVSILVITFLTVYLAYEPGTYRDAVLKLVPAERRDRGREIFADIGAALRLWMIGQLGAMAVVGTLVGLALWIAGFPGSLALGVIAGILTFVPIVGPLLAGIPGVIVGVAEMGLTGGLIAVIIYTGAEAVESYLATPLFQKSVVRLPPAAVLGAQLVMGVLFGLMGIFLSTPLLVVAIVAVQTLYVEDVLGEEVEVMGEG